MDFRTRLLETLRAIEPILGVPGVLVVGSEVPNLLEPEAASTLVVSQDVDIGIPVSRLSEVKLRLDAIRGLTQSEEEPSVWLPEGPELIEVNFLGMDPNIHDPGETYALLDARLPLLVFGPLSLLRKGKLVHAGGCSIPLPAIAGLLIEKLLTDRTGEKGDRDVLVALGLMLVADDRDLDEAEAVYRGLSLELQHAVRANLTVLSLLDARPGMPDPRRHRVRAKELIERLEQAPEERR